MTWYSDSETIYYSRNEGDGQIWQIDFGVPTPVAQPYLDPAVYRTFSLSVSGDGQQMLLIHDPSNFTCDNFLSIHDFSGPPGNETTIYPSNGLSDFFPDFSPTSCEIAWAQHVSACGSGNYDVWIINCDGTGAVNLTPGFSNPTQQNPVFSDDGDSIYFQHNGELWEMSRDGSGKQMLFSMSSGGGAVYFDVTASLPAQLPTVRSTGLFALMLSLLLVLGLAVPLRRLAK